MNGRIGKAVEHVKENRTAYIVGGACFAAGAAGSALLLHQGVIVDSFKFQWKTVTHNEVATVLARRGHPGNIIKCNETGELFASQNRAAQMLGLNPSQLAQHLGGKLPHVQGHTFTKLGEAQAA